MWCAADNHNYYVSHICAEEFLNSNLIKAVIDKISNLHVIATNFTYSQKSKIFKYNWKSIDQLLLPYTFLWQ